MGLLDDLKKQADALKAQDTDKTESLRSTAVAVDHSLRRTFASLLFALGESPPNQEDLRVPSGARAADTVLSPEAAGRTIVGLAQLLTASYGTARQTTRQQDVCTGYPQLAPRPGDSSVK